MTPDRGPSLANLATWMLAAFFLTAFLIQGCMPDPPPSDLILEIR